MTARNTYAFCHADGRLEHFPEAAGLKQIYVNYEYITAILVEFDTILPQAGLQIVATWAGNIVPKLDGDRSLLLVVGDERGQVPNGAETARLLFRTGSPKDPWSITDLRLRPLSLLLLSTLREARNIGLRFNRWLKNQAPLFTPPNVDSIPIGYVGRIHQEPLGMELRKWDVSFAGGIGRHLHRGGMRLPLCSKAAARLAMLEGLETLSRLAPRLQKRVICSDLHPGSTLKKSDYFELLQQTKISLCPRGNFPETFRLFESAYLGCVVFTDPLPPSWYFRNHPFIEVRDWRNFAPQARALLNDKSELQRLGNLSRKWWDDVASPQATARKIADRIEPINR